MHSVHDSVGYISTARGPDELIVNSRQDLDAGIHPTRSPTLKAATAPPTFSTIPTATETSGCPLYRGYPLTLVAWTVGYFRSAYIPLKPHYITHAERTRRDFDKQLRGLRLGYRKPTLNLKGLVVL